MALWSGNSQIAASGWPGGCESGAPLQSLACAVQSVLRDSSSVTHQMLPADMVGQEPRPTWRAYRARQQWRQLADLIVLIPRHIDGADAILDANVVLTIVDGPWSSRSAAISRI